MLNRLQIKNYIIIEDLDVSFNDGFTVFSGETGAGKSLIIDALKLFLVKRIAKDIHKDNASPTIISAAFNVEKFTNLQALLKENFIFCEDGELLLKRVVNTEGKSKAFINNEVVTVSFLNEISGALLEIHGQHETHDLFDIDKHISFIDSLVDDSVGLDSLDKSFVRWNKLKREVSEIENSRDKAQEEIEYLDAVVTELDNITLTYTHYEELLIRKESMKKSKELGRVYDDINNCHDISGPIGGALLKLQKTILHNVDKDEVNLTKILNLIDEQLKASDKIVELADISEFDAAEYEHIEEQISEYNRLARKHGVSIEDLERFYQESLKRLKLLKSNIGNLKELKEQLINAKEEYISLSEQVNEARQKASAKLEKKIEASLHDLYMAQTEFRVAFAELPETNWSKRGNMSFIFTVKTNPGQPFGELSKIASGGELSRFMLSLKLALKGDNKTLIFDEIDSGISGKVSNAVGDMLKKLSTFNQTFIITHQAQVAAKSNHHLRVIKDFTENSTNTNILLLNEEQKLEEIARMISGNEVTEEAIKAAQKLVA